MGAILWTSPASMRSLEPEDSYTVMDGDPKRALREEREWLVKINRALADD